MNGNVLTHPNFLKLPEDEQAIVRSIIELGDNASDYEILIREEIEIPNTCKHVAISIQKIGESDYRLSTVFPTGRVMPCHFKGILEAVMNYLTLKKEIVAEMRRL